ncbi:MAG: oligosaccharide flippase family protein, partial [bacterium]|nr:oligosaccharide flippase family protein [bacterium]
VAVIIFSKPILSLLKAPNLNGWLYLSPLFLFLTGVMNAMTYFANRRQDYFTMARSKMVRSCSVAVVGITLGVAGFGAAGLLSGVLLGTLAGVGYLFYRYRMQMSGSVIRWSRSKKELLEKYKDYPRYNATSGLLNGLTSSMPIFFLTNYFSGDVVGFFALVVRVTEAPLTLISP